MSIEKLNLQATEVGDLGLEPLTRLKNLKELNLGYTTVSDAGLQRAGGLRELACAEARRERKSAGTGAGASRWG